MTSPFPGLPAGGGSRSSLDRVRDALQARGSKTRSTNATQVMAACPVHDDGTPSLSVRWVHGQRGGTVLLNCHGCGGRAARPDDGGPVRRAAAAAGLLPVA